MHQCQLPGETSLSAKHVRRSCRGIPTASLARVAWRSDALASNNCHGRNHRRTAVRPTAHPEISGSPPTLDSLDIIWRPRLGVSLNIRAQLHWTTRELLPAQLASEMEKVFTPQLSATTTRPFVEMLKMPMI